MTEDEETVEIPELGPVEYIVSDGVIYEPTQEDYGDWLFVRRGEVGEGFPETEEA